MNSIFYFLVNPFAGFIQAFNYRKMAWAKNSIMLFVVFYGFTMVKPEGMDSSRYVLKLENLYHSAITWNSFILNFYNDEGTSVDIYQPLLTFIVSLFTDNGNVLFALFGLVYGYFFSRNIFFILDKSKNQKIEFGHWLLLFTFICTIGFWELNGVRMWTAAQVFLYGVFHFFNGNKKTSWIAIIGCVFVHFSFALLVGLFIFYFFIKVPVKLLYVIYLISFFVTVLNLSAVGNFLTAIVPDFLLPRVNGYTDENYAERISESSQNINFYAIYYKKALSWFLMFYISLIFAFKLKNVKANNFLNSFFEFSLILLILGNFISFVPSGIRYVVIAQYFMTAFVFIYLVTYKNDQAKDWVKLFSPLLFFYILVSVRISFETITLETILFNPLFSLIGDLQIPLIDLIK